MNFYNPPAYRKDGRNYPPPALEYREARLPADRQQKRRKSSVVGPSKPRFWKVLGPGLITGASDDDPSGIATYSQAGAQFGYQLAWALLFTYPLMTAVQMISARIGRITGSRNRRKPAPPLFELAVADHCGAAIRRERTQCRRGSGSDGEASRLLVPAIPAWVYIVGFGTICTLGQVFFKHTRYVAILQWVTLSLFAYFGALFMVHVRWDELLRGLLWPSVSFSKDIVDDGRRRAGHDD